MKRNTLLIALFVGFVAMGASTCSSDPNVEGAKLDLRNKDFDRALENLEVALERNPDNAEALDLKGQVLQEKLAQVRDVEEHTEMLEEMVQAYRRAIEVDPTLQENTMQRLRLAYFNEFQRGMQAFNEETEGPENYETAYDYFTNAAYVFPDSSDAYVNQAYALLNAGRRGEAADALEQAMEAGEDKADTYVYLADLYRMQERHEDSIELLEEGLEKYPENEQLWSLLLNEYVATEQVDEAMSRYEQLVEQAPNNQLYRFNYGTLLLNADRYEDAVEQLQRAVELDPEYPNAQYNLAAAYVNEAVALSERIGELDDEMRENRTEWTDAQMAAQEERIEDLEEERRELFHEAIPPLETALGLFRDAGEDATDVCQTLFTAYVQTQQNDKAESIAECAGYEDLN